MDFGLDTRLEQTIKATIFQSAPRRAVRLLIFEAHQDARKPATEPFLHDLDFRR